jgi:hypothetical protein
MKTFYHHMFDLIESIEDCKAKGRQLPCLALLYTGIDVVASLDTDGKATRQGFINWTDNYLLKAVPLHCTGMDLYAARCAVVHTFTPDSDLSRSRVARVILYATGNTTPNDLENAIDKASQIPGHSKQENYVIESLDDLILAFRTGIADYLKEIEGDSERQKRVEQAMGLWYSSVNKALIDSLLAL